jgi:hypothetical protein
LPRQSLAATLASSTNAAAFKYADAQEIATASLRHTCLQPQTASSTVSLQTLPHHYANFATLTRPGRHNHHQFEATSSSTNTAVPDILQQAGPETAEMTVAIGGNASAAQNDRHVIVNQLLTFLTEKQQKQQQQQQQQQQQPQQLIDIDFGEPCSASTTSTLKLTE